MPCRLIPSQLLLALLGVVATAASGVGWGHGTRAGLRGVAVGHFVLTATPSLKLRGGFDPLRAVSPAESTSRCVNLQAVKKDPLDDDLLQGDVQRMFAGEEMSVEDKMLLNEQMSKVADDVHLTQQFLVLQKIRLEDQMPGGANCSYAETWFTGALWEKSDDEFQWTRAAWLQVERAKTWQDMPSVWKRIQYNAWEDMQDFLAMLALPDGGKSTAKFAHHEEAWNQVRAAYMSNVNRKVEELASGGAADHVAARKAAAQPYVDAKCREPQVSTIFEWLGYTSEHLTRKVLGEETADDKMLKYQSVEVQLFGIPLFNTKDPVSERLWSMASSQGETVTGWPLKAIAWIVKKMERVGSMAVPPEAPMTSETHVLLKNTRYHKKFDKDVDQRRSNALDRLHEYVTSNFAEKNSSVWHNVKEDFDQDVAVDSDTSDSLPVISARSYTALDAQMRERLDVIAQQEHTTTVLAGVEEETEVQQGADGGQGDVQDVLVQMLSSLSIRDSRKALELVFKNHGGGELRMVGMALNVSIPTSMREWLDDPYADQDLMARLLLHPRVKTQLTKPDILQEPMLIQLD
mmetsp:Transcript_88381/g.143059  ORF Transcript_88381/g.143059 Transcript_88381/m.143059 type:complete len:575 (-) Transcript_88381:587-2311(-)